MNYTTATANLTTEEMALVQSEVANRKKSPAAAWLLWLFTGGFGGHRFYLGNTGYAVAMLLLNWATLSIWALIDAFFINKRLRELEEEAETAAIQKVKLMTRKN